MEKLHEVQLPVWLIAILFVVLVLAAYGVFVFTKRWAHHWVRAWAKALIRGDVKKFKKIFQGTEMGPIVEDLDRVLMRLEKVNGDGNGTVKENEWNAQRLRDEVHRLFGDSQLCVIANREPCIHNRKGKRIETQFPASGLVTAVEPIVRACSGLWIGHGSGSADRETADSRGRLLVPPQKPEYALKRVWLTREEENGYYYGFSNEGIWPLCHIAHTRPIFRPGDWQHYRNVNQKFAKAFVEEMTSAEPIALIQDYHFALLPQLVKEQRPDATTSLFWHIPWPNPEAIDICPWKNELLRGMLGSDLIGFHIQQHCNNFLDSVDSFLEARVDRENFSVTIQGHTCFVKPFPISVEWPPKKEVTVEEAAAIGAQIREENNIAPNTMVGLGVDRLDYTKGIVERARAVERMLETHPEWIGKFVFIQIAAPSRTHIRRYQELETEVRDVFTRVNIRFGRPGFEPMILKLEHHAPDEVSRYYVASDVCVVSSLHDGMNLVAKEYVASRSDLGGALVLSSFTGAARAMTEALIVNPYDVEQTAEAIYRGITMDPHERRERMARLRSLVANNNVYAWAGQFLDEIHRISQWRRPLATGT